MKITQKKYGFGGIEWMRKNNLKYYRKFTMKIKIKNLNNIYLKALKNKDLTLKEVIALYENLIYHLKKDGFRCEDCKVKVAYGPATRLTFYKNSDYMVTDELWAKYGNIKGYLCEKCFDKRRLIK